LIVVAKMTANFDLTKSRALRQGNKVKKHDTWKKQMKLNF